MMDAGTAVFESIDPPHEASKNAPAITVQRLHAPRIVLIVAIVAFIAGLQIRSVFAS
jgi:hypothetical protein